MAKWHLFTELFVYFAHGQGHVECVGGSKVFLPSTLLKPRLASISAARA